MRRFVVVLLALLFSACSGAPSWVKAGGRAVVKPRPTLYGVGWAGAEIASPALRRTTAENRARADLARLLEGAGARPSARGGAPGKAAAAFMARALHHVEIVEHWSSEQGELFALARLDLERYYASLEAGPSEAERRALEQAVASIHAR